MSEAVFTKITAADKDDFEAALEIYEHAFPLNERHPQPVIRSRVSSGLNEVYIGRIDGKVAFMALLWPLNGTDFILLDYMATHPGYRGRNFASAFLQSMQTILEKESRYFILEVENPAYGNNKPERERRIAFYGRNGAGILKDVTYLLPALQGVEPTEMLLMVFPKYKDGKIESGLVKRLIVQIYRELYNRDEREALRDPGLFETRAEIEIL